MRRTSHANDTTRRALHLDEWFGLPLSEDNGSKTPVSSNLMSLGKSNQLTNEVVLAECEKCMGNNPCAINNFVARKTMCHIAFNSIVVS